MAAPVTSTFDPIAYKATTQEQWQAAAEAWHRWGPTIEQWLGEATETMLDLAGVGEGARVLDVAAGAGGQTLTAARRVGPAGRVLASDIAPAILDYAAAEARRAGLANVATRAMDGEQLDVDPGTYDAVISRVGLIYFPDQQRALSGMRRALSPGGRVAAIVYSTPDRNQFFSLPVSIIRRRAAPAVCPRPARPVQPRRPWCARRGIHGGRVPRRGHQACARAAAAGLGGRLCPVRAGVVRRAAPDARRPGRARSGGGLDGDSRGARPVRRLQRVRGPVRDAGGCRDQVGLIASAALT